MATTLSATTASAADLARLADHRAFRRPDEVAALVTAHPEVIEPLFEAVEVVPRFFGPHPILVLEPEFYPETIEDRQLSALIQTALGVDAAIAAYDRFCEGWWLENLPRAAPHLTFGFEFA
jgi:hypothetical protein